MNNPIISLEGVEKRFGSNLVVKKMNLEIAEGEFLTLLGPSGCGKTTTLRMIAGFEEASAGVIKVEGRTYRRQGAVSEKRQYCFPELCIVPTYDGF